MKNISHLPWASGPGEILKHGLSLLRKDTDTNRRLAMISIDNSVELMIKTFLGLPKRITGLAIPRKEYRDMAENFPSLLDGLEKYAPNKLDGIDLGTIEWYHRLRNELYHQGNGLTVEKDKVEIYSELANLLFKNLFGEELIPHANPETELLGEFMAAWVSLEAGLRSWVERNSFTGQGTRSLYETIRSLYSASVIDKKAVDELDNFRKVRNDIVHGKADYKKVLTPEMVAQLNEFAEIFIDEET